MALYFRTSPIFTNGLIFPDGGSTRINVTFIYFQQKKKYFFAVLFTIANRLVVKCYRHCFTFVEVFSFSRQLFNVYIAECACEFFCCSSSTLLCQQKLKPNQFVLHLFSLLENLLRLDCMIARMMLFTDTRSLPFFI